MKEEHKKKLSEAQKKAYANGRVSNRKGLPSWNKGLTKKTNEILRKQSEDMKGIHYTPQTEFKKGHVLSQESKDVMSKKWNHEKHFTPEARKKLSIAGKNNWKDPEYISKTIKAQRQFSLPTRPEIAIAKIIEEFKLPFLYTGDGKITIGKFNPDFLAAELKKIIEVNGDYFHNLPHVIDRDKRKQIEYKKQGFKCLVIWEEEIKKDLSSVKNKVMEFAR